MKLRRIFSLLIAAALIVSMLPLGAIATDHEELISEAVAAPQGAGGENSAGAPQPEETIEIPEGEPEGGVGLPSDVIGGPEDKQGETPAGPGAGETPAGPGAGETPEEPGAGETPEEPGTGETPEEPGTGETPEEPGAGETPQEPGTGDPAEGEDPEQPEGEDPAAGEEGEEPAEEAVDVTTLFGEELARYIEELEAKEDMEGLVALVGALTEEQFQSLIGVETTSRLIAEMWETGYNDNADEEEAIEYYPASVIPAGPIIQGSNGSGQTGLGTGMRAAGRMIAGAAGFGVGLLSEPASVSSVPARDGMTVGKSAVVKGDYGPDENDRQFFQLDLTVHVESDYQQISKPVDVVLVLDVSGSMGSTMTTYSYSKENNPSTSKTYYIDLDPAPNKVNWQEVTYKEHLAGPSHWGYNHGWFGIGCVEVNPSPGGTGTGGNYQFYTRTASTITKLQALKDAVNSFLASVKEDSPESKVAIVTYAGSGSSKVLTGTKDNTAGALIPINVGGSVNSALTTAVNGLTANGGTYSDEGFQRATKIMQGNVGQAGYDAESRNRVVIHFTDGEPGSGGSVSNPIAADVIRWAKVLKNDVGQETTVSGVRFPASGGSYDNGNDTINPTTGCGATVYTVGVFANLNDQGKTNEYMWRSSSNTKDGSAHTDYSPNTIGPGNAGAYYLTADSADSLTNIFDQIGQEMAQPVQGSVRDYISEDFEICDASGVRVDTSGLQIGGSMPGPAGAGYVIKRDANGIYAEWSPVTIEPGETLAFTVYVKPKENFIGGNNLLTNIGGISAVYSGGTNIGSFPEPKVNVPFKLGTGEYVDDIYLGSIIDSEMVTKAQNDMLNDIFKGYNYSTIATVTPSWTTDPTNLRPTDAVNNYGFSATVNPVAATNTSPQAGRQAKQTTATGTYTVNVHGATLTAQGWTILKGQTAVVLSGVQKTLTWDEISGEPVPTDVDYEILYNGSSVTSNPQLTESRTFTMVAKRANGQQIASATFTVDVVCPTFTDKSYNILLGESVGERYGAIGSNLGVGISYGAIPSTLRYGDTELTYTPNTSDYGSPVASHIPIATGTYTVPVTVYYAGIEIGSATVTINVSVPTFTGKTFHLLNGEPASADGYNAHSDGVNAPDYAAGGVPSGLTYSSLTYTLFEGTTLPGTRLSADAVNKINVSYNGHLIAQNVEVKFKVYTPTFAGNTFNLFYGETVKSAYPSVTTAAGAITINAPASWPEDRTDRWTAYKAKITAEAAAEFANALDTVYPPGNPAAQFPVTMKYVDDSVMPAETRILTPTYTPSPKITINVVAGSITITKSVTNTGNKGVIDPDQTFLFKITRMDGDTTEVFYEYITGNGTKTITGLKKGVYTVEEVTDWSWRYELDSTTSNNQVVTLGRTNPGTGSPFTASGSTSFTNNKKHDSWLSDEATPKANDCGTVPIPGTQSAQTEAAILPGKQNGLPEAGSAEQA